MFLFVFQMHSKIKIYENTIYLNRFRFVETSQAIQFTCNQWNDYDYNVTITIITIKSIIKHKFIKNECQPFD